MAAPMPPRTHLNGRQRRRIAIWWSMTPEQRDYDRFVARQVPFGLPLGEATRSETGMAYSDDEFDDDAEASCSCHINPPCSFCTNQPAED